MQTNHTRLIGGLAILLSLWCQLADAGVLGRNRLHIVRKDFARRLRPATQKALEATVRYDTGGGWGTAFVVQQDGRDVLAFTNNHVTKSKGRGAKLEFLKAEKPGTVRVGKAVVVEVVATSPELDYSLVRARLTRDFPVEPLTISRRPLRAQKKVVAIGFPSPSQWARAAAYDQTPSEKRLVQSGAYDRPQQYVQVGRELGGGEVRLVQDADTRVGCRSAQPVWSVALGTTSAGGASGSPILAAEDHTVRALHWTSGGTFRTTALRLNDPDFVWTNAAYAVPMPRILDHLKQQLAQGLVSAASQDAVHRLIGSVKE